MAEKARKKLSDHVYEHLVARLRARSFPVGSRLNVLQLAKELAVSRTTIGHAIERLIDSGWVTSNDDRQPVVIACPPGKLMRQPVGFKFSSVTDATFQALLGQILRGAYKPGHVLKELPLATELGVTTTTVKRAAEWLAGAGLLTRLPRRGWQVVRLDDRDLQSVYRLRGALESLAVARAVKRLSAGTLAELRAENERLSKVVPHARFGDARHQEYIEADYNFHRTLLDAAGNRILTETVDPLIRKSLLITTFTFSPTGRC